jgi:hypothetical protein
MKAFIVLLALLLPACSLLEDDEKWTYPAGIDSLSIEKIEFRTVDFLAHISCGSMCWNGYYFQKSEDGNDVYLKLFVTSDGTACPAVCVERSFSYKYRVLNSGTYNFLFWKNDSTSIDTTITFN